MKNFMIDFVMSCYWNYVNNNPTPGYLYEKVTELLTLPPASSHDEEKQVRFLTEDEMGNLKSSVMETIIYTIPYFRIVMHRSILAIEYDPQDNANWSGYPIGNIYDDDTTNDLVVARFEDHKRYDIYHRGDWESILVDYIVCKQARIEKTRKKHMEMRTMTQNEKLNTVSHLLDDND